MPGPLPKPEEQRRRKNKPIHAPRIAPGFGWQHGKAPLCPRGLSDEAQRTWKLWMESWTAAMWERHDLSGLEITIKLYDATIKEPKAATATALRLWLDSYGLSPAGAQRLRWQPPIEAETTAPTTEQTSWRHLRAVDDA